MTHSFPTRRSSYLVDSLGKKIYYLCQLAYLWEEKFDEYYPQIKSACLEFVKAAPSTHAIVASIGAALVQKDYFKLLKLARRLIEVERRLLDVGKKSLPDSPEHADRKSTRLNSSH